MARMPRLAVAGQPHLVVQRGADLPVFRDDVDRSHYLAAMAVAAKATGVALHAYCLLDDTVLLLASPRAADALGSFMQRVGQRYVPAFHRRHGGGGTLWSGRFQAAALEPERYLLPGILLVEQAPVRAGGLGRAIDWPWSSAGHHAGRGASTLITEHAAWWRTGNTPFEREARHDSELRQLLRDEQVAELLGATRSGWPLGSAEFVAAVGEATSRAVQPRPRGRPRRSAP